MSSEEEKDTCECMYVCTYVCMCLNILAVLLPLLLLPLKPQSPPQLLLHASFLPPPGTIILPSGHNVFLQLANEIIKVITGTQVKRIVRCHSLKGCVS